MAKEAGRTVQQTPTVPPEERGYIISPTERMRLYKEALDPDKQYPLPLNLDAWKRDKY